jgi:gamma-glutamylputrescine oxidase
VDAAPPVGSFVSAVPVSDYVDSFYSRTMTEPGLWPALDGTIEAETCVIGGGLAGLATALDLAERGRSVLLEAHRIGWGASGRNGGFMSPGFGVGVSALIEKMGLHRAREMYALSKMGHALVGERIAAYGIDCGPVEVGGLRCAMAGREEKLEDYCVLMAREFDTTIDYWPASRVRDALATTRYADATFNPNTWRVHPLNLARGLARAVQARGGRLFEQSRVSGIDLRGPRREVTTARGTVRADHVVFACGGYIGWLHWPIAMATVPLATFVMVTEPLGEKLKNAIRVPFAVSDIQSPTNYYRPLADGRLMWGGRILAWQPGPRRLARALSRDMASFYPDLAAARVEVAWGGLMAFHRHRLPVIGRLADEIWCAAGFGGLGLASTTMAGRLIGLGIAEGDDRWRLFTAAGLPFAGGVLGRVPAQLVYWRDRIFEARAVHKRL